jgi:predicted aspartyl protease
MEKLGLKKISEVEIFGIGSHQDIVGLAIAEIIWFGRKTEIEILINDGDDRLLGSELLDGKILRINYRNKKVSIAEK